MPVTGSAAVSFGPKSPTLGMRSYINYKSRRLTTQRANLLLICAVIDVVRDGMSHLYRGDSTTCTTNAGFAKHKPLALS